MKPSPFSYFFSLPLSFSSLHYAGSLTLFDRMCYLQPPAAVPLSLSLHRWQLNPAAACHSEAGKKWWFCCLKREWEERKTDPKAPMCGCWCFGITSVLRQGFSTASFQVPCSLYNEVFPYYIILLAVQGSNLIDNTFLSFDNLVCKYVTTVNQAVSQSHVTFSCFSPDCINVVLLPELQLNIDLKVNHVQYKHNCKWDWAVVYILDSIQSAQLSICSRCRLNSSAFCLPQNFL